MKCGFLSMNQPFNPMKEKISGYSIHLVHNFSLILFFSIAASSASGATFSSVKNGDWNDPCTWTTACASLLPVAGITIPGANDDVIISNKHEVTLTADVTVKSLAIDNGIGSNRTMLLVKSNVTLRITGTMTVDANGELVIEGGALVYVDGSSCVKTTDRLL